MAENKFGVKHVASVFSNSSMSDVKRGPVSEIVVCISGSGTSELFK
jgi:hypothetical protein